MDKSERDGVGTDTEGSPFFGDGFGETNDGSFGSGVVGLADVPVKTGSRGDVDDGAVLAFVSLCCMRA